jgi:hypothetical protein
MKSKRKLLLFLLAYCGRQDSLRAQPSAFTEESRRAGGGNLRTLTGVISSLSDRNAKTNFEPVDARDMLARVAALPNRRWNFKNAPMTHRHIGPMAQDYDTAFNVGLEDTDICTVDAHGVALTAIQGLSQKVEAKNRASRPWKRNSRR